MVEILIKLFIKDYQNVDDTNVRNNYGLLASIFGIISNIISCLIKLTAGILFNLISLIGDGLNNLSDASSSIVSLVGFKLANKPADKDHPYGHARIEYIAGFIISIIIVVLGFQIIIQSISGIVAAFKSNNFTRMDNLGFIISIVTLSISILLKIYQGFVYNKIAKKINSLTLKAAFNDSRNDVLATSILLIGLVISQIFSFYIDGYLSFFVGLFICYQGINLIKETADPLIGEKVSPDLIKNICEQVKKYDGILGIHDVAMHSYGYSTIFATIHVEMDGNKSLSEAHDIVDQIEKDISSQYKVNLTLHMDPVIEDDPLQAEIKLKIKTHLQDLKYIINIHDFRIVKCLDCTNIIFDAVIKNNTLSDLEAKKEIEKYIIELDKTYNPLITIDRDYSSYFD